MDGDRKMFRRVLNALALAAVLTVTSPAFSCPLNSADSTRSESKTAGEGKQPENRNPRERCKRTEKGNNSKTCPDGGERLPQDKPRSPLDDVPPLTPLVA